MFRVVYKRNCIVFKLLPVMFYIQPQAGTNRKSINQSLCRVFALSITSINAMCIISKLVANSRSPTDQTLLGRAQNQSVVKRSPCTHLILKVRILHLGRKNQFPARNPLSVFQASFLNTPFTVYISA